MNTPQQFGSERLGRRRFSDNKSARNVLYQKASIVLTTLLDLLPSNYPVSTNSNLAQLLRTIAYEFGRLRQDVDNLNADKTYTSTRIQFLQQILGERLFLKERIVPSPNYNDETYRDYIISLKDAYLVGSTKDNIEEVASKFTKLPVNLRELYLEARKPSSSYDVSDSNMMIVEVFVDDLLRSGRNLNEILHDLDFFVNLIRPAHVLYDTNLIWTEQIDVNKIHDLIFGDTGGGCVPVYDYTLFEDPVVVAYQVLVTTDSTEATGRVSSIQIDDRIFFLDNGTRVITEPGESGTSIYGPTGRRLPFEALKIGQYVKLISVPVPGRFKFWWKPPGLDLNDYSLFYRDVYRRPYIQENVKKEMDSKGRFPLQVKTTPTTVCDRWVADYLLPFYEDFRHDCNAFSEKDRTSATDLLSKMGTPRLSWPWDSDEVYSDHIYGNGYEYYMEGTPVDGTVSLSLDGTDLSGAVTSVDATTGLVLLTDSTAFWDASYGRSPAIAEQVTFGYSYLSDGTSTPTESVYAFGIANWQMPYHPLVSSDGSSLADTSDVSVSVDGTAITGSVRNVGPLLGHVTLFDSSNFWNSSELGRFPQIGDEFSFSYWQGINGTYSMRFDDCERGLDTIDDPYTLVFDGEGTDSTSSDSTFSDDARIVGEDPYKIGYRYRAYHLHHSSVLNSPDTLRLNDYQKPALRASLQNQQVAQNHMNLFFSGEFLDDTSQRVYLDDAYLENGLDPILKLYPGTPPFQKTWGYQPGLVHHRKLQDIRQHRHPLMYSDLLLKEFVEEGADVNLSSICDNDTVGFKIRFEEEIPSLEECDPWVVFDEAKISNVEVTIPGEMEAVPNVRVMSKKIRLNFILREMGYTGTLEVTYETNTPSDTAQTVFWLPETFVYDSPEYGPIDFPSLPIMKDSTALADPSDISVTIDGVAYPGGVSTVDPLSGRVEISAPAPYAHTESRTVSAEEASDEAVMLEHYPSDPNAVTLSLNGNPKTVNVDYVVMGQRVVWFGGPMTVTAGDTLDLGYTAEPLINASVEFTYKVMSTRDVEVVDDDWSRITDDDYVLASACPDPIVSDSDMHLSEYYGFLDDYSEGITVQYFNKDTYQVERHVFSGPLFEIHEPSEDEFGSPESFHGALVKIKNPIHSGNPLKFRSTYTFLDDPFVRFKKKTFKELLPDRTFRTIKIMEMAPL